MSREPVWTLTTGPYSVSVYRGEGGWLEVEVQNEGKAVERFEERLSSHRGDFSQQILEATGLAKTLRETMRELQKEHELGHER
jgi:hypothetical protein